MNVGPERDEKTARADGLLVDSLEHAHRAIDAVRAFELYASPHLRWAWQPECLAARASWLLGRYAESLFHAEAAAPICGSFDARPEHARAMALFSLGFPPQAIAAMRRARENGLPREHAGVGDFFLRAAAACEARGLISAARAGFETAVDATPEGPRRDAARARLDAVSRAARAPGDDAREAAAIARLDEELARLPRSCPSRREPPSK
jgi:hypothetical protein